MAAAAWTRWPPPGGALLLPLASPATAAAAVALEAPCRPLALAVRGMAARWIARAGAGALPSPRVAWAPPLAGAAWATILADLHAAAGRVSAIAVRERRQPGRRGFTLLLGGPAGPIAFVKLRPAPADGLRTERLILERAAGDSPRAVSLPAVLGHGGAGGWRWTALSLIPPFHRPPGDAHLGRVTADIACALRDLPRPVETPAHWLPMHGDLTPWNLREAGDGRLWLYDWERAAWAPPGADLLLYRVSAAAVRGDGAAETRPARGLAATLPEAAAFWAERLRAHVPAGRGERRLRDAMLALLDPPGRPGLPPRRATPAFVPAEAS